MPYIEGNQDVVEHVVMNKAQYGSGRSSLVADRSRGKPAVLLAAIFKKRLLFCLRLLKEA